MSIIARKIITFLGFETEIKKIVRTELAVKKYTKTAERAAKTNEAVSRSAKRAAGSTDRLARSTMRAARANRQAVRSFRSLGLGIIGLTTAAMGVRSVFGELSEYERLNAILPSCAR